MCGHTYDPAKGEQKAFTTILCNFTDMESYQCKIMSPTPIPPGTDFSKLPADWKCPSCGYPKSYYRKVVPDTLAAMRTINY
jgi:rubredoxin